MATKPTSKPRNNATPAQGSKNPQQQTKPNSGTGSGSNKSSITKPNTGTVNPAQGSGGIKPQTAPNSGRGGGSNSNSAPAAAPAAPAPAPAPPAPPPRQADSAADRSQLDALLRERAQGAGGYRSTVLTTAYGIPGDGNRATRSLQSFNGRNGSKTVLGQ